MTRRRIVTGVRVKRIDQLTSEQLLERLGRLEAAHGMNSEGFYRLYLTAQIGSADEEMEWAIIYEAAIRRKIVPAPDLSALPWPATTSDRPKTKTVVVTPEMICAELARYEAEYGMSSAENRERILNGKECPPAERMVWDWYYDAAIELGLLTPSARA